MTRATNTGRFFTTQDVPDGALEGESVTVLGYGHLGRPAALNLRDSGVQVIIGNIEDEYAQRARTDGFHVVPVCEAVADSDIVLLLLPDEVIPEIYESDIAPSLRPRSAIVVASGYTLAYELVTPQPDIDVLLMAPRMAGENARQRFVEGDGFYAYVDVDRDASGRAWHRLLGLANGIGILRKGALQLDLRTEADIDLFIEQTMGAAIGVAIMSAFAIGEEAGIPAEAMVMEMYMSEEMEMVFRAFREEGFFRASTVHGPTAMFGGFVRTMELMMSGISDTFRKTLDEIQSGEFARKFQAERAAGYPTLAQAEAMTMEDSPISEAEDRVRRLLERRK
jgi:ketol-acid reductoisomerase